VGYRRVSGGSRMWLPAQMDMWSKRSVGRAVTFETDSCDVFCAAVCLLAVRS